MAENNFRKGPHAAKNKIDVDMSSISPSADERKTVVLDEDLEGVEFEDKVWLYWTRNKNFIVFSVILVLAVIIGVQGFKMYKASRAASLASAYEAVSSDSQLLEFAKSNAGTPLAGAVQIQVADAAYSSGDYAKAASLYDSSARELSGTVLFGRAKLGAAASVAMADPAKGKAQLKAVYDDAEISPAYRAQAGYLLGLLEKSSGNIEAAKSIFKAMSENESFGMYSRVAEESLNEIN